MEGVAESELEEPGCCRQAAEPSVAGAAGIAAAGAAGLLVPLLLVPALPVLLELPPVPALLLTSSCWSADGFPLINLYRHQIWRAHGTIWSMAARPDFSVSDSAIAIHIGDTPLTPCWPASGR